MTSVYNPVSGNTIAEVSDTRPSEVGAVYDTAEAALREWRERPAAERGKLVARVASAIRERAQEVAELETANTGRPLRNTRGEAARAAQAFDYYAGFADKVAGSTLPVGSAHHTYTLREPRGIALGIIPWNAPYVFAALKIAPAIALGNVSILKPAAETPLSALRLAEIARDAGLPEGVLQVVTGGGDVGAALVEAGRADVIAFTGHHDTGKRIGASAARNLTLTSMELGGKSPQLVFADADLDAALDAVLLGVFGQTGQMCIAGSRIFVQGSVYDDFLARLERAVADLVVGDPSHEGVQIGPQTTAAQRDKTLGMIAAGEREGGRIAAQASVPAELAAGGGYFVPPTVFCDVGPDNVVAREEVFGPVVTVAAFSDEKDALRRAHDTSFGLAAGVWTADIGRAHRVAAALDVGTVWINTYRVLSVQVPFGGVGQSGAGREGGAAAVDLYTRVKSVWTALRPGVPGGYRL